jgi:uncharacterized membrane protein
MTCDILVKEFFLGGHTASVCFQCVSAASSKLKAALFLLLICFQLWLSLFWVLD